MEKKAPKEYRKIFQLTFTPEASGKPVICELVRHYDVTFNIVAAETTPGREGYLTLEIWGEEDNCKKSLDYLREQGIGVAPAKQNVSRDETGCMHCGMCTAICPVDALFVDATTRLVGFNEDNCTACGACTRVCPVDAMHADMAWF